MRLAVFLQRQTRGALDPGAATPERRQASDRSRLVIGPFRNSTDAQTFADDLQDLHITAFSWTNSPSDTIVPLNDAS